MMAEIKILVGLGNTQHFELQLSNHGLQWLNAACVCCVRPLLPVQRGRWPRGNVTLPVAVCDSSGVIHLPRQPAGLLLPDRARLHVCVRQMSRALCLCFIVLSSVNETHMDR